MKLLSRFFGSAYLPSRQKKAIKFEIWTLFACSKEIYQFWGGLIWKAAFSFGQHIPQPFSVTKKNSCGKLYFRLLPFQTKNPIKFEIWTLLACSKEIDQFWGGWFGKLLSGFAQTFHDPSVSKNETLLKVFWLSQFTFQRKESNKIWDLDPIHLLERNLPILGGADLESCFQFWPTHSTTLQCHKINLLWEPFLQAT